MYLAAVELSKIARPDCATKWHSFFVIRSPEGLAFVAFFARLWFAH